MPVPDRLRPILAQRATWLGLLGILAALEVLSEAEAMNLTQLEGTVAVADSEYRDRWGLDGFHAQLALDGNPDGTGAGGRTTSWISDNWEVTHELAVVFPQPVAPTHVRLHWPEFRSRLAPARIELSVLRADRWEPVGQIELTPGAATTEVAADWGPVSGLRLAVPPDAVHPGANRIVGVAEIEVEGEPTAGPMTDVAGVVAALRAEMRARREREDAERVAPQLALAMEPRKTAGFEGVVDRVDLANGLRNLQAHAWARAVAERTIASANWWLDQSDEYICDLIPAENPRALCPSFEKGCPLHGGARHTFTATLESPYEWVCSKGGERWFDGCTVTNPGTGEEVVVRDDGHGWLAPAGFPEAGRRYYFVAAYRYFVLGKLFNAPYEGDGGSRWRDSAAVEKLALAYAYTGDRRYAHKAAVMLNRLAECYRYYDGCVEGVSPRQDGYIGQGFEKSLIDYVSLACDLIWDEIEDDVELREFFAGRGDADYDGDGQVTGADFTWNLQHNLLGYMYEMLHRLMPYMDGDFLMYEMRAMSGIAHTLRNPGITAEILEGTYGLRVLLNNSWFRDGKFIYDSASYNRGNALTPLTIAENLHGLTAPSRYPEPLDIYHDPQYRVAMLYDFLRNLDCDGRVPQIGDGGGSRDQVLSTMPRFEAHDERALLRLPEQRAVYLQRLLAASGGDPERYRATSADWWLVFHAQELPPAGAVPPLDPPPSSLFEDGGLAILRAGADAATRVHVPLTFTKGSYGHGHTDKLAINLFRYGYDWSADLGYPTTWTDRKYPNWETDTASHCTVMLDETEQRSGAIGELHWFARSGLVDAVEASAEGAYPQADLYRRTVGLVRDRAGEPLYVVDIFRTAGARTRDYLFHSLGTPEDLAVEVAGGVQWTHQPEGSLAGPDVPPTSAGGYSWLHDLYRAPTDSALTATWTPSTGSSQPDRYLLTRRAYGDAVVQFTIRRTGMASGDRERAVFVFGIPDGDVASRKVIMLPAASFEIGRDYAVRIEIAGGDARMTIDGQPAGSVDVVGAPVVEGNLGLLHYYNYAWEYRDLTISPAGEEPISADLTRPLDAETWGRIDPTYEAVGGVLQVRDAQPRALRLRMLGAPGREVIRAQAEGYGLRGQSPMEGHLIVRQRCDDPARVTAFVAVIEAFAEAPRVLGIEALDLGTEGATGVLVRSRDADGAECVDLILSALDDAEHMATFDGRELSFAGRFGILRVRDGEVQSGSLVGGGHLALGDYRIDGPGAVTGRIVRTEPDSDAIVIELAPDSATPSDDLVGRVVRITRAEYVTPAIYTVMGVEPAGAGPPALPGQWRLLLNLTQALAFGTVGAVAADGSFASATPIMKLRVNPGLFDGKLVSFEGGPPQRLRTATENAFVLAADPEAPPTTGQSFVVYDIGPGDEIAIMR